MSSCRLAALVACAALARAAGAQHSPPPERAGGFVLAAGADAAPTLAERYAPALAVHAGYERRLGGARSPFALRVAGDYWRQDFRDGARSANQVTTIHGAGVYASYAPSAGRVRPYLLGGVGIRHVALRSETDRLHLGPGMSSSMVFAAERRNSIVYVAGLGLSTRVGPTSLFMEARATFLPGGVPQVGRDATRGLLLPITLGVRF
jgi:hypothetical protein